MPSMVFTGKIVTCCWRSVSLTLPENLQGVTKCVGSMALLMGLITCFVVILAASQPCRTPDDFVAATSPGQIMIGGLFAIHEKMLSSEDYPRQPVIQKCVG